MRSLLGRPSRRAAILALSVALALPLDDSSAQGHGPPSDKPTASDVIMPHITDSKELEFPCIHSWREWACHVTLPTWNVHIGDRTIDLAPTKHVVLLAISATLALVILITAARRHTRETDSIGRPRGAPAGLEAIVLYLRNEIYLPVLGGHGGEKYVPYVITLFFFILFANVIGLIPYSATPTGNVGVTATLALITFFVVEIAGMRALGRGYFNTIVYWPHDMPLTLKLPLTLIMTPIELVGKFTKPFALTIRLFANMVAGHVVILSLILLIFTFGWLVSPVWLGLAVGVMILEVLVATIQAFIFSLLSAVFIGQIRMAHH